MAAPEIVQANPRKRAVLALAPLTIVMIVVMLSAGDKAGPYHGKIRLALTTAAFVGLGIAWFVALRATKTCPRLGD